MPAQGRSSLSDRRNSGEGLGSRLGCLRGVVGVVGEVGSTAAGLGRGQAFRSLCKAGVALEVGPLFPLYSPLHMGGSEGPLSGSPQLHHQTLFQESTAATEL